MFIEPKMQSPESYACDAHVKYVTEAVCLSLPFNWEWESKEAVPSWCSQGRVVVEGETGILRTHPQSTEKRRGLATWGRSRPRTTLHSENMQEQNQVGAGVKVLEWSS